MKIDIITNFSFGKLRKKWTDSIKPEIMENLPKDAASRWKKNILEKSYTPLQKSTIEIRKNLGRGGRKPLVDTKNLYRSITAQKTSVKYLAYGEYHLENHKTSKNSLVRSEKTVPARKWKDKRFSLLTDKSKKRAMKKIRQGLRRAGKGKIIARY